jgi:hypothetical protein
MIRAAPHGLALRSPPERYLRTRLLHWPTRPEPRLRFVPLGRRNSFWLLRLFYVQLDDRGAWKLQLAEELKAANISVDMNKAL